MIKEQNTMPSYNLISTNNLGDVSDIHEARSQLFHGDPSSLSTSYHDRVSISDGSITAGELRLNVKHRPTLSNVSILESVGITGKMKWSTDREYDNRWIYQDRVHLSGFNNDETFIQNNEGFLHHIAFSGNYNDITCNLPQTNDFITQDDRSNLLNKNSNLIEFNHPNGCLMVRSNLNLGDLAYEPLEDGFVFMNTVSFSNLELYTNAADEKIGWILQNTSTSESNILRNTVTDTLAKWTDPYINELDGRIKPIFTLSPDFTEQTFDRSVQCAALSNLYRTVNLEYFNADENVFPENVELDLMDMINDHNFLYVSSNLADRDLSNEDCRSNLHLGNIATKDSNENPIIIGNISVQGALKLSYLSTGVDVNYLVRSSSSSSNIEPVLETMDIQQASSSNYGLVRYDLPGLSNVDEQSNVAAAFTWTELQSLKTSLKSDLEELNNTITYEYLDYSNHSNVTFLDHELSQYDLGRHPYIDVVRSNLELSEISISGRYVSLLGRPRNAESFRNDIDASKRNENCVRYLDTYQAQMNLGLGDVGRQNSDATTLMGTALTLDTVQTDRLIIYDADVDNTVAGKWISGSSVFPGQLQYQDLPLAGSNQFGIVKLASNYLDVAADKVVTVSTLRAMRNSFNERIDDLTVLYNQHRSAL
jgi:hypothetical protein